MQKFYLTFLLTVLLLPAFAQVSFQFVPEVQGRNVDGLFNARIITASVKRNVTLTITVSELKKGKVFMVKTPAFSLNPGSNTIPASAVRPAKIQFANNTVAEQVQRSGMLPQGEYEYCFTLSPEQSPDPEVPLEQCFSVELTPFSPLNLNEPADKDSVCQQRPLFTWQPTFPVVNGAAYQLQLVEIKEKQSPVEALNYNLPVINQNGIVSPALPYPNSYKELKAGKRYAWQVSLYKNQTVLNRSEIWEFTVGCKDSVVKKSVSDGVGFRDIEDLVKGNYYIAKDAIRFSIVNPYQKQTLKYEIECLTDPSVKVKRLPDFTLEKGLNEITIDVRENKAFRDLYYYQLKVWLANGSTRTLRILIKEDFK